VIKCTSIFSSPKFFLHRIWGFYTKFFSLSITPNVWDALWFWPNYDVPNRIYQIWCGGSRGRYCQIFGCIGAQSKRKFENVRFNTPSDQMATTRWRLTYVKIIFWTELRCSQIFQLLATLFPLRNCSANSSNWHCTICHNWRNNFAKRRKNDLPTKDRFFKYFELLYSRNLQVC